jgi:hypothetical protein
MVVSACQRGPIPQLLRPNIWAIVPLVMKSQTTVLAHRGLSPHQSTPMSGAHQTVQRMSARPSGEFGCLGVALIADLGRSTGAGVKSVVAVDFRNGMIDGVLKHHC